MKKKIFVVAALGAAAVLVAGGLVASNMGFKANYLLEAPDGGVTSNSGTQGLALPYNIQTSLSNAESLIADINGDGPAACLTTSCVESVERLVRTDDSREFYTGTTGVNFTLVPGDGYVVVVNTDVNYIIVGSHNPVLSIQLDSAGVNGSLSGTQLWSYPYHSTAATAEDLINEINLTGGAGAVASVAHNLRIDDSPEFYTGTTGVNFTLVPGESYEIVMNTATNFVPAHY